MCSAGTIIDANRKIEANRALRSSNRKRNGSKRSGILGIRGGFNKAKYIAKGKEDMANIKKEIAIITWNDSFRGIFYTAVTGLLLSIVLYTFINIMMG